MTIDKVMVDGPLPDDLIRDLVQCVQAARDGAAHNSLFAIQCDLVLARAAREVPGVIKGRAVEQPVRMSWDNSKPWPLQMELKSQ